MEDIPIDPNSIIASFAIPPKVFLTILANGLLQQGFETEGGPPSGFLDALFGDYSGNDEPETRSNHEQIDEEEEEDEDWGHGNKWRDWPDNPNEYL